MKTLLVMRHAKAVQNAPVSDHDRPLTDRGKSDAEKMGNVLAEYPIDYAFCSTAMRAKQTWANAQRGGASATQTDYSHLIYTAWCDDLITAINDFPPTAEVALLVGHQPTVSGLVGELTGLPAPHFPTAALAVLTFDSSWAELSRGSAELLRMETAS